MTCGCNDKCELPKALQINNPGEVTLFHRVDIPASQGDDETYPPKNGLYRNVLLVYLANNHSYLYNSDGIPTRVDGPAGPGTAAGGETGQVLAKRSDADYDTTWVTQTSANDAKLTLTRNNTEIGDFTANASVDKTIDIEVPTKTSDLENDGADNTSTYVEADDYATASTAGVVKVTGAFGTEMSNSGELKGAVVSTSDYPSMWNDALVSKGTLENALSTKINDATLTVTQNGTTAGTFTANSNTNTTIALTDTTYTAGEGVNINGTTIDAKVRRVYNYYTSRPASANTTPTGNGGMFTFQATSSMTTGKPKNDAHILQLEWDNTGGYDSQIAVSSWDSAPWLAYRAQSGTWGDWRYVLDDVDNSVKTSNINALAVTTAKIADGAITAAKIAPGVIPTVNDATLTIQQNGTTVETFTANSSTNKTANITVPTKTSDLTNDGATGTSTYVETDELVPDYITGEGTDIALANTQGGRFSDVKLKGDTTQGVALPDGYQQVEYIASAGGSSGAYIDSGVKASNATKIITTASLESTGWLFGEGLQGNYVNIGIAEAGGHYRGRIRTSASSNTDITSTVAVGSAFHTIEISQSDGFWIDGTRIGTFASYTYTSNGTIYIHAWQNGSGATGQSTAKIKDFKIYDNNTLVKWFVPCKRISDGVAGYYEMVGGAFKPSASSTAFTAGGATPTPSTPQTVQTVTGEQTVKITGKNLFNIQGYYDGIANDKVDATLTFENDAITWTNTSSDSYIPGLWNHGAFPLHQDDAIPVESNTTYTLSFAISGNISNGAVYIYEGDASYNGINNDHVGQITNVHNATLTFTTSATTKFIIVRFARWESTSHAVTVSDIQLEKGSTATDFEPYQNQTYTINLGKNLLNTAVLQTGFINESGVLQYNTQSRTSAYIEVLPNTTYTASADATYRVIGAAEYTAGKTFIKRDESIGISSYSLTTTGSTKYIRVYYNKDVDITAQTLLDDKAQIEKGSTRTDYNVYADQIELCRIGDKQDYIYQNGGDWYLHKETAKIVDNGASGWGTSGAPTASGVSAYVHTGLNIPDYTPGYANMATLKTKWSDWTSGDGLQSGAAVFNSNNYYLKISTSIASTVAQLKAFLGGAPLITYYPLATPTDTPITGALLDDLNAFDQATSYNGDTYITVSSVSPDLPATLSVTAEEKSILPTATETSIGVVSVGDGLSITDGGVLSLADNVVYSEDPGTSIGEVVDPYTYSTTETRVGTWIDGKPLYRKVVNFGALPNATTKAVAHGLSNFRVRNFYSVAVDPSNNITFYLPTLSSSTSAFVTMYIDANNIVINTMSTNRSAFTECYVTIEYTKTTD